MSSVWYCIPSARPPAEAEACLSKWREMGYKIALFLDKWPAETGGSPESNFCIVSAEYPGYAQAVNALVAKVLEVDASCDWVVTGGDDVFPDPNLRADEIAAQCSRHFSGAFECCYPPDRPNAPYGSKYYYRGGSGKNAGSYIATATFGVMQPTGDRWGDDAAARKMWPDAPAMIDRICGSPWIGREFARRVNGGKGPLWPEYFHNWVDQEAQEVAIKLGVFWQRRDLIHYHDHPLRKQGGKWLPHQQGFSADYVKMEPLFRRRQAAGFPGHEPLP